MVSNWFVEPPGHAPAPLLALLLAVHRTDSITPMFPECHCARWLDIAQ